MYKIHILYKVKDGLKAKSFLPYTQIYTQGGKVTTLKNTLQKTFIKNMHILGLDSFSLMCDMSIPGAIKET